MAVQQFQDTIIKLQTHEICVEGFEDNMESKERAVSKILKLIP